jgi:serine/threonine protein kinase
MMNLRALISSSSSLSSSSSSLSSSLKYTNSKKVIRIAAAAALATSVIAYVGVRYDDDDDNTNATTNANDDEYNDQRQHQQNKNQNGRNSNIGTNSKTNSNASTFTCSYSYKTLFPTFHWHKFNSNFTNPITAPTTCQCDAAMLSQPQQQLRSKFSLQRRSTIRRLNAQSEPISNLNAKYNVSWKLPIGEGAFSTVYVATNRNTNKKYAIKKIPKMFTDNKAFQNEIDALLCIQENGGHPHISSLNESFEDDKNFYLVLDLVTGGEMFDHLVKLGAYSEADAARLVREAAMALCFIHGVGLVHGDLKPENLMLSTDRSGDCTIQLVDFGCAHIISPEEVKKSQNSTSTHASDVSGNSGNSVSIVERKVIGGNTPAYCPPEALVRTNVDPILPPVDMWSLGIILYIMLTGLHPYDLNGNATDEEIEFRLKARESPPLHNSPITAHLSPSAIDVIDKCMKWDANERITAQQLLDHPWVRGETAREGKMNINPFKANLEAKVFADFFSWSDTDETESVTTKTSLIERAFNSIDVNNQGFLTNADLKRHCTKNNGGTQNNVDDTAQSTNDEEERNKTMSLSCFSNLLGENMKNRYFPRGMTVYKEGEIGNHMYFINSGIIEVTTKDGSCNVRRQGNFFGEGALLHPKKIRSASIKCLTPVHALEISREYFEKYLESSGLSIDLKEKDKTRKRNRAKTILRLQKNLNSLAMNKGYQIFTEGEEANALYILERGLVNIFVDNKKVFSVKPGDIFGEHSMIMSKPRNTSAKCMSEGCVVQEMKARDFYELYNSSSSIRASLRELCLRREFQKALVKKTKKEFPSLHDLRDVFDAADIDRTGFLNHTEVAALLTSFDPSLSEEEIKEAVQTMDLDETGNISFDAFKLMFG